MNRLHINRFNCSIARNQNKVVLWFVKPLIVIHFEHIPLPWFLEMISDSEPLLIYPFKNVYGCVHYGLESSSERRFGSRSKTWFGSWFELCAFTWATNAFLITISICALRGNILLLLRSPRALIDPCAYAWLQRAFLKCTRTNHVPKEFCVHMS